MYTELSRISIWKRRDLVQKKDFDLWINRTAEGQPDRKEQQWFLKWSSQGALM